MIRKTVSVDERGFEKRSDPYYKMTREARLYLFYRNRSGSGHSAKEIRGHDYYLSKTTGRFSKGLNC